MEKRIMTIFTRTPLHVGAGNSVGAVDAPVMRERHTRIPIIPGTSLKGVLADLWLSDVETCEEDGRTKTRRKASSELLWLFGSDDANAASAGALLIGEARVLAFPVRSAKGGFAWVTCPLALARYKRDAAGAEFAIPEAPTESECLAGPTVQFATEKKVILEEYCFAVKGEAPKDVTTALGKLSDDAVWQAVGERLVIVSDELFTYFVEHACEVVTRVRIDDATGTVAQGALFNQEQVPSETLFYAVIAGQAQKGKDVATRKDAAAALGALDAKLKQEAKGVLQLGGDETTGLGWCSVAMQEVK
ncbi:MAG: type III-B CRISPR module RAMP protein Cmr4 [Lentisphaerae bacterium RIFOXYB12_FULL_65_16]|nr:MAG: type III-B CRISPR module RAMP protein Cmr4 [Lentisphaerae bacterium RIFOXYA12_64_32]OGV88660.1 MAG: type III-B CRISPR module RAMP protein Cmr4 [Lentisphaerae bacterium RIFOXYB12_FULL_65_16]